MPLPQDEMQHVPQVQDAQRAAEEDSRRNAAEDEWRVKVYAQCRQVMAMDPLWTVLDRLLTQQRPPCSMTATELGLFRMGQRHVIDCIRGNAEKAK